MKKFLVMAFAVAFLAAWVVPSVAGVDFSGQYRVRGEIKSPNNFVCDGCLVSDGEVSSHASKKNDYIGQRVRLTGVAKPTSDVTVKVTIQDTRDWGKEMKTAGETGAIGAGPQLTDKASNVLDLHESYVLINDFFGLPVDLKVGRQELVYGDQRLIGAFGWDNNGSSFDAIKLTHKADQFKVDLFYTKNLEADHNVLGVGGDADQDFYGLYSTININANNTLDAYLLYLRDGGSTGIVNGRDVPDTITGAQNLWTIGARLKGTVPMANPIDYTVELPYQFGNIDGTNTAKTVSEDADIKAWAFAAKGGITINGGNTRLGAEYDWASGDDNDWDAAGAKKDGDIETFSVLSPTQHGHYGMMDQIGWRNISAWSLNASHKVNSQLKVSAAYWNFQKAVGEDSRYGAANWMGGGDMNPSTGTNSATDKLTKSDDAIGQEIDLQAAYKYNSNVVIKAGYGHFFTDAVIEDSLTVATTGKNNSDDMDYGYLMLVANF